MDRWLLVIAVLLLVVLAAPAEGGAKVLDGTVRVEWLPDPVKLMPGQSGSVGMTVQNTGDDPICVILIFQAIEGPGGCRAEVTPDYFELDAHEARRVTVDITTHPRFFQDPGTSNCYIEVFWGRNLTRDGSGPGQSIYNMSDGWDAVEMPVSDVPPYGWASLIAIVVPVVVVAIILHRRGRAKGRTSTQAGSPK